MLVRVQVRSTNGSKVEETVDTDATVAELKQQLAAQPAIGVPAEQQRLIFKGAWR